MLFLGRWLFRLWLGLLALPLLAIAAAQATFERLARQARQPWTTRVADRVLGRDDVVVPALVKSFSDDYQHDADGPGFSEQQIPKLWGTVRALAQALGCAPPDAIHLSLEAGNCMAWTSRPKAGPTRRHIALSLLDLRLVTHDEGRAVIAHEIVHVGFDHLLRDHDELKQELLMVAVIEGLPFPLTLPVYASGLVYGVGRHLRAHDDEREADRRSAAVVGGNHASKALSRIILHAPVLERVFNLVLERALAGPRAPLLLAEAALQLYRSNDFEKLRDRVRVASELPGPQHPSLPDRVEEVEKEPSRAGIGGGRSFIEAYPELVVIEEQLTKTYFPDTPAHTRSDASQLRRKALVARLKRR